jgi:hypothetical protein
MRCSKMRESPQRRLVPSVDFREGVATFIGERAAEFRGE